MDFNRKKKDKENGCELCRALSLPGDKRRDRVVMFYLSIGGPIDSHLPKWSSQVIRYNIDLMVTRHMHVIVIACFSYTLKIQVDYLYWGEGE